MYRLGSLTILIDSNTIFVFHLYIWRWQGCWGWHGPPLRCAHVFWWDVAPQNSPAGPCVSCPERMINLGPNLWAGAMRTAWSWSIPMKAGHDASLNSGYLGRRIDCWLLWPDAFFQQCKRNFMRLAAIIFLAILQWFAKTPHEDCAELRISGMSGPICTCRHMHHHIAAYTELFT